MRKGTALLALTLSACSSWRYSSAPAPEPLSQRRLDEVRLLLRSGKTVNVFDVNVNGDSIVGYDRPSIREDATRIAVATRDVESVAVRQGDVWKTIGVTVLAVFAVTTLAVVAACASIAN